MVAMVAISEFTLSRVTTSPLNRPTAPANSSAASALKAKLPVRFATSMPTQPAKASDAPTDRSISPAISSMVMPAATISTSEHWRRITMMLAVE